MVKLTENNRHIIYLKMNGAENFKERKIQNSIRFLDPLEEIQLLHFVLKFNEAYELELRDNVEIIKKVHRNSKLDFINHQIFKAVTPKINYS
jgi:hypothetical protein